MLYINGYDVKDDRYTLWPNIMHPGVFSYM